MKLLRFLGASLLLILVLLSSGITYLSLTEAGSQWLFTQIARVVPGELHAQQVKGHLGKSLTLRGVHYQAPDFTLEIAHLNFTWRAAALLRATLWIEQLHLQGVTWRQLGPAALRAPEGAMALPEVQLPLRVRAESIQVRDFSLLAYEAPPVAIEDITLQGYFANQTLQLITLGASAPEGQFQVQGKIVLDENYSLELATQWQVQVPGLEALIGIGKVTGDLHQLTLQQELQVPMPLQLRGRLWNLMDDLRWALILDVPEANLQRLHSQWPAARLGMNLRAAGGIDRFKVQGAYQFQEVHVGRVQGEFSGEQAAPAHWTLHHFNLQQVAGGKAEAVVHGAVVLLKEEQPHLFLTGQWQDLAWPLEDTALVASDKGQFTFSGYPDAYRLHVKAALNGEHLPASEWLLAGTGDVSQFQLTTLQAHLLGGTLNGMGRVRWDPALNWQFHLRGEGLNPAEQWSEWPGELDFHLTTQGRIHGEARAIAVDLQTLTGILRGYPVSAQGEFQLQGTAWQIRDVKLRSGASWLLVEGRVDERLALDWQLNSPDLDQLLPAARGTLSGQGRLGGRLEQPQVSLRLQGRGLAYQAFELAAVEAAAHFDLEGKQASQLAVKATGLVFADQILHSLRLQGSGTPSQHELQLAAVEKPARSLTLQAQGVWREEVWKGEILTVQLTDPIAGHWASVGPTSLTLSRHRVELAPWCWQRQTAQLCLGGSWQEGQYWEGSFKAANFPLETLAPVLPEGLVFEGMLASEAVMRGYGQRLERALVQINISAGRLLQARPDEGVLALPHQGLQAKFCLDEEAGEGHFEWLLGEQGESRIGASLRLPPVPLALTAAGDELPLFGRGQGQEWEANLAIVNFSLSLLEPFLPEQVSLEGTLRATTRLQGEGHYLERAWVQLDASAGRLIKEMPEQTLALLHQGLEARLHLDQTGGSASLQWLLAEFGAAPLGVAPVNVALRLPPAPLDLQALDRLPLDGKITATLDELTFLQSLLPEIQDLQGQVRIDLTLGGWVKEPQVLGQVGFHNGEARVPLLGLELTQMQLRAEAHEMGTVIFNGEVHSGEGRLTFQGQVGLDPASGWPGQINIVGERFEAARTPEVRVSISPRLQITSSEQRLHIEGEVTVPRAYLSPVDITQRGGVPVSEDAIILSAEREAPAETRDLPIQARVRVILGDEVRVKAYGLTGRIVGSLVVTDIPERRTRGSGELRIAEGQYAAYGVQLDIQEGRVIFVGPVDEPRVNVRAVRQVGDVVAGIHVQGAALSPELTLFSEPTMNEQDILAYLILGRPLRAASGEDGRMLASAAVSLGLAGGNLLAQRIGRTFGLERVGIEEVGIEEVGVGVEKDPQRAALMLGRHLSPRLYVSYGVGIFQRFSVFRMRYMLTRSWSLQAETGLESSMDLFYDLER